MHHHIDMVTHTMAFVKPVMVPMVETEDGTNEDGSARDRTGDLSHRMRTNYHCTTPRPLVSVCTQMHSRTNVCAH